MEKNRRKDWRDYVRNGWPSPTYLYGLSSKALRYTRQ